MPFAENLKRRRLELKFTLRQLSLKTGIAVSTLSNYENNIRSPSVATASIIAKALHTTLDELNKED